MVLWCLERTKMNKTICVLVAALSLSLASCGKEKERERFSSYAGIIDGESIQLNISDGTLYGGIYLVVTQSDGTQIKYYDSDPLFSLETYCITKPGPNRESECLLYDDLNPREDLNKEYLKYLSKVMDKMSQMEKQ